MYGIVGGILGDVDQDRVAPEISEHCARRDRTSRLAMTILAGAYAYPKPARLSADLCQALRATISRYPSERPVEFKSDRVFLVKIDIGAFGEPAFHWDANGAVSMLAGEPLLDPESIAERRSRTDDLALLHGDWVANHWQSLARSQGTFCAVHYNPERELFALIPDKLGVRLLYYWHRPGLLVFATALRILERVDAVPKVMDFRGVGELLSFGYHLRDRTPYVGIKCLNAAEIFLISKHQIKRERYWRWDRIPGRQESVGDLAKEAMQRFIKAVGCRIAPHENTMQAFLSGGLDSRIVATVLVEHGKMLHTLNSSQPDTYDKVLSKKFAECLGSIHHDSDIKIERGIFPSTVVRQYLGDTGYGESPPPGRPGFIWSGDGGSVGVGCVHLNREIVDRFGAGKMTAGIESFLALNRQGFPYRFMHSEAGLGLENFAEMAMKDEIDHFDCSETGQIPYLFLLLNDQRRHLTGHFEEIDLNRVELHLPFFDGAFLELVVGLPIDEGLYHKFYHRWLKEFPAIARTVAWQTYPGHLRCPLPMPENLRGQWDPESKKQARKIRTEWIERIDRILQDEHFPSQLMNKKRVLLARWATKLGLRNYFYVFHATETFSRYLDICGGACDFGGIAERSQPPP